MTIAAKTVHGKSLISLTVGSLPKGLTIVKVLLLGMGTYQGAKANHSEQNTEAWHVDGF